VKFPESVDYLALWRHLCRITPKPFIFNEEVVKQFSFVLGLGSVPIERGIYSPLSTAVSPRTCLPNGSLHCPKKEKIGSCAIKIYFSLSVVNSSIEREILHFKRRNLFDNFFFSFCNKGYFQI
jgi:hypothetical protein